MFHSPGNQTTTTTTTTNAVTSAPAPSATELRQSIGVLLEKWPESTPLSARLLREQLEEACGVERNAFVSRRNEIQTIVKEILDHRDPIDVNTNTSDQNGHDAISQAQFHSVPTLSSAPHILQSASPITSNSSITDSESRSFISNPFKPQFGSTIHKEDPISCHDQDYSRRISLTQLTFEPGPHLSSNSPDMFQRTQPNRASPPMTINSAPNRLHTLVKQQPNALQISKPNPQSAFEVEDLDWSDALLQCEQQSESISNRNISNRDSTNPTVSIPSFVHKEPPKQEQRNYEEPADEEGHINGKLVDLGKNKLVTISMFNGKALIHLREYYRDQDDGLRKPTKKGIALAIEQWNELCSNIPLINSAIEQFDGQTLKRTSAHRDSFEPTTPYKKQYIRRDTSISPTTVSRTIYSGYPNFPINEGSFQDSFTGKPRQNNNLPSNLENKNYKSYFNRNTNIENRVPFPSRNSFHVVGDND